MSRFFKTLKPYWKSVLLIIALLVLQAYADLSLPQYTSDIIDTGIEWWCFTLYAAGSHKGRI